MSAHAALRVASAGSTVFGAGAAAATAACAKAGFAPGTIGIFTDHGHVLHEQARAGWLDADVVLLPAAMIDDLERAGMTLADNRIDLGRVAIGAAMRTGQTLFDVSARDRLAAALLQADEIVLTLAPTGEHMMQVIDSLGLFQAVASKIIRFDKSADVNAHLAASDNRPLAFGPATEILSWAGKGIAWCGPVPQEFQIALPYAAACLSASAQGTAAQSFLAYLATDDARACFAQSGVEF